MFINTVLFLEALEGQISSEVNTNVANYVLFSAAVEMSGLTTCNQHAPDLHFHY